MRINGRIHLKINGLTKNRENMKKDKSVQNRSKIDQMFPPCFPGVKRVGKQNRWDSEITPKGLSGNKDCFPNMERWGNNKKMGKHSLLSMKYGSGLATRINIRKYEYNKRNNMGPSQESV